MELSLEGLPPSFSWRRLKTPFFIWSGLFQESLPLKKRRQDDEESPDDTSLSLAPPGGSSSTAKSYKKLKTVKEEDESFLELTLRCSWLDAKSSNDDPSSSASSSSMPIPENKNILTNNPSTPEGGPMVLNARPHRQIRDLGNNPARNADEWDIKKRLEESDVNSLCRLLLSRTVVKDYILPHWDDSTVKRLSEGVEVTIWDTDTMTQSQMVFKLWKNRSYVFVSGWSREFVKRRELKKGDTIGLHWDQAHSRFNFGVLDRANP